MDKTLEFDKITFSTETVAEMLPDGTWKAVTTVREKGKLVGTDEWIEEKVESMAMDDTVKDAVDVSTRSVLSFMIETVYQQGYVGLIEYFANERAKKEQEANDSEAENS